jgi:asparagine synthase (glutamine-hydrolysing)
VWVGKGAAFGHRRLAIVDLDPRSDQPMVSRDGNYSIVFNGEIYNFRELRRELQGPNCGASCKAKA